MARHSLELNKLSLLEEKVRAEGVTSLFIFGSRARGDHRPDSDLDVFVDYDRTVKGRFSLIELAAIKVMTEEATQLEVHITTRNSLDPEMRPRIEVEQYAYFERKGRCATIRRGLQHSLLSWPDLIGPSR